MAKMKTVTINGEKYIVSDPDAVLYTAQALTPEQQAQARANIGAVTLDEVLVKLPVYNGEVEEV